MLEWLGDASLRTGAVSCMFRHRSTRQGWPRVTVSQRFKGFEVRPERRVLLVDGQPAEVGSRAFDLLLMLIAHRDRVVTKQELLAQVWPRMVVEDNNLQSHVSALRKLIGAESIATVQGRGYRFTLEPVPADPDPAPIAALPVQPQRLAGRADELQALARVLRERALVNVIGPGGIGKTALALHAATDYGAARAIHVCWVDLARLPTGADAARVGAAIAHAAALPAPAEGVLAPLAAALRERSMLLVLDNAEHVLDGVAGCVHALRGGASQLRLLVTSQAPLGLPDETLFRLDGLALAPQDSSVAAALGFGAVALFVERAQAVERGFTLDDSNLPTVIAICRQLGGLPLALRLAVSRLPVLGLDGIALHLQDSLNLLRSNERHVADRHQTMQAALNWSYGLLAPAAQQLFCRVGLFVGGFRFDAALALAPDLGDSWRVLDHLQELTERSMLHTAPDAEAGVLRYHLPECARQYAVLQFQGQEGDGAEPWRRAHAHYCLGLMEQAYDAYWRSDDDSWLQRYAPELDNVRRAFDWALQADAALAARLAGAASPLFMLVGMAPEARRRAADAGAALALDDLNLDTAGAAWQARFWLERSRLEWGVSSLAMRAHATRALALYRRIGDRLGSYLALRCAAVCAATSAEGKAMLAEMGALEAPEWGARAHAQRLLTQAAVQKIDDPMAARGALDQVALLGQQAGLDAIVCAALGALAEWCLARHDYGGALAQAELLLARRATHRGNFLLLAHGVQANAHFLSGDCVGGKAALGEFARAARLRNWEWLDLHGDTLALCAACRGRFDDSARLLGFSDAARSRLGARDNVAAALRERAALLCAEALTPDEMGRLQAQGAVLGPELACRLALGESWELA